MGCALEVRIFWSLFIMSLWGVVVFEMATALLMRVMEKQCFHYDVVYLLRHNRDSVHTPNYSLLDQLNQR